MDKIRRDDRQETREYNKLDLTADYFIDVAYEILIFIMFSGLAAVIFAPLLDTVLKSMEISIPIDWFNLWFLILIMKGIQLPFTIYSGLKGQLLLFDMENNMEFENEEEDEDE